MRRRGGVAVRGRRSAGDVARVRDGAGAATAEAAGAPGAPDVADAACVPGAAGPQVAGGRREPSGRGPMGPAGGDADAPAGSGDRAVRGARGVRAAGVVWAAGEAAYGDDDGGSAGGAGGVVRVVPGGRRGSQVARPSAGAGSAAPPRVARQPGGGGVTGAPFGRGPMESAPTGEPAIESAVAGEPAMRLALSGERVIGSASAGGQAIGSASAGEAAMRSAVAGEAAIGSAPAGRRAVGSISVPAGAGRPGRAAGGGDAPAAAVERMQARRAWASARAEAVAREARRAGRAAGGRLAAAASSAAAPLAGVLAGVLAFAVAALAASQALAALVGFWQGEAASSAVEGLPPYVTYGMVEAALGCQEEYGHPAGCTLAQLIVESGEGDSLSALAERDSNLFGIKWSASFMGCPEVAGKASWETREVVDGEEVAVMADFARFASPEDCIAFRSRVVLAGAPYAGNALVGEAVRDRDSDKMAEGLADAGWATSPGYAEALVAALDRYGLRRFDSLALADLHAGGPGAATGAGGRVVEAARSQLGVPYVWGGTEPGVGLDCSGLTQWCYAQAGKSIPRNSEDQAAAGRHVPLSRAEPGDVLWRPGHVAVYVGGDEYIHEPQSGDVCRVATGISYFDCALRF